MYDANDYAQDRLGFASLRFTGGSPLIALVRVFDFLRCEGKVRLDSLPARMQRNQMAYILARRYEGLLSRMELAMDRLPSVSIRKATTVVTVIDTIIGDKKDKKGRDTETSSEPFHRVAEARTRLSLREAVSY
eukprot:6101807-Amphidinium_carterae.1